MTPDERLLAYRSAIKHIAFSRGEDFASEAEHLAWAENLVFGIESNQKLTDDWLVECIGAEGAADKTERIFRFFEEACELAQAANMKKRECKAILNYVFKRPVGKILQEVGGVLNTLFAFCTAHHIDAIDAHEIELTRAWHKIENIRQKHLNKPRRSPLPGQENPSWYQRLRKFW